MFKGWSTSANIVICWWRTNAHNLKEDNVRNALQPSNVLMSRFLTMFFVQALTPTAHHVPRTPGPATTTLQRIAPDTRSILRQPPLKQSVMNSLVDRSGTPAVPVCPLRSHLVPMWLLHPTRRRLTPSASGADLSKNLT